MNPTLKKILTAVALKKVYDRVQEARNPRRARAARVAPALGLLGLAGVGGYLFKSGKLQSLIGGGASDEPAAYPTGPALGDTTEVTSGPSTVDLTANDTTTV